MERLCLRLLWCLARRSRLAAYITFQGPCDYVE
jgi:hypothetical protein